MLTRSFRLTALLLLTVIPPSASPAGGEYFPETGPGSIRQRSLDLRSGTMVMYLALQPGMEDLPLLARIRMGLGGRTVVVYVTNGDATPNDMTGEPPQYTAAARKEEALSAVGLLGGIAYFLNLPDPGIVGDSGVMTRYWDEDTLALRFHRAVQSYRPDLLYVGGDLREPSFRSVRHLLLAKTARRVGNRNAQGKRAGSAPDSWVVPRIYQETASRPPSADRRYDGAHPIWKKSYRQLGDEAAASYQTLRFARRSWNTGGDRTYELLTPGRIRPNEPLDGLPVVSPRMAHLSRLIRKLTLNLRPTLPQVSDVIDSVERVIAYQGEELAPPEIRLISAWKNILEDLRCSLLGVTVRVTPSDTVLTQLQLWTLSIDSVGSATTGGRMRVIFPGAREKKWGINESAEFRFDLKPPQAFRVLSPAAPEFNTPLAQFGAIRPFIRTRFAYFIYHEDSIRSRNFVYRGEVHLRFAPKRTFEILTPAVRAQDGEHIRYRLINVSRDGYRGTISLSDSLLKPAENPVVMEQRNDVVAGSLVISPAAPLPEVFPLKIQLSGEGISSLILARSFDASTDSSARPLLVTPYRSGVVEEGLRRLRIPFQAAEGAGIRGDHLARLNVLILDREALAERQSAFEWMRALGEWVGQGGHLVIFPQTVTPTPLPLMPEGRFLRSGLLTPDAPLERSESHEFLTWPNRLGDADWGGWVVSRAMGGLDPASIAGMEIPLRAASGAPLLATARRGKGRITLIGLDLTSQLVNIHPGAHRLLANIIRRSW